MGPGQQTDVVAFVILGILAFSIYLFIRWLMGAKGTADPWGDDIEKTLAEDEAVPVCHHCLTPQQHSGWFCPECGATTGPYCNYLPYVNVFSQGEVLRAGVTEHLRRRPLIVFGYLLLPFVTFTFLLPLALVYWFFLFKNLRRNDGPDAEASLAG
jgi:hypothetical protein